MAVILFTGHRLDEAGRSTPRFPPARVPQVQQRLQFAVADLAAAPVYAAVCSLAAGGDLLFAQECLRQRIPLHAVLPFEAADFVAQSVAYPKAVGPPFDWLHLYQQVRQAATSLEFSTEGPFQAHEHQFLRCNEFMLARALHLAAAAHTSVQALLLLQKEQVAVAGGSQHFSAILRQQGICIQQLRI